MNIEGFLFAAVEAGVRYPDRKDIGLIYSELPCVAAGVFTSNQVIAAPVVIDKKRLEQHQAAQAVIVNSGCANACTGEQGMQTALRISKLLSQELGVEDEMMLLSSTGVIGEQLNLAAFESNVKNLVSCLSPDGFEDVAKAIMTTDTVHKMSETKIRIGEKDVRIVGMAKGAGMIMPNMATMLAFILTDAVIAQPILQNMLSTENEKTFNRITVDGDTSTNDMVLLLANGKAGNAEIDHRNKEYQQSFQEGLAWVLKDLALQIVRDGEGATKTITIKIKGARSEDEAEKIGRTVATSSLVKTAFFGEDANWGRILAAMGRSGVNFSPDKVDLYFGDVQLVQNGLALGAAAEKSASEVLKEKEFSLTADLKLGKADAELYTSDFSIDYVKINADYRS